MIYIEFNCFELGFTVTFNFDIDDFLKPAAIFVVFHGLCPGVDGECKPPAKRVRHT